MPEVSQEAQDVLRVGVFGIGSMGRHHARVVRETPGLELVAIADPGGDKFGVARGLPVHATVQDAIKVGLDAAIVCVPTVYHEEVALQLAAARVHTMVEKPIAADSAAGERVAAAFAGTSLVGAVGYVERCNAALLEMRRLVAAGALGEIYQVQTRRQGPFPARISDVGVVKDLATHDIDLAAWVAGSPHAAVAARVTRRSGREHEDMTVASGVLENGVIVNHVVNWLSPFKERATVVTGERGALVADTGTSDLTFFANGTVPTQWDQVAAFRGVTEGDVTRYALARREPLRVEAENFRDAVLGLRADHVTMAEGLKTLRVVEAVLESAETGLTINL